MVVFLHSDFSVFGWPETIDQIHLPLLVGESFCIIGVNVFVLITGYFSTTPKLKSLLNLAYICLFYAVLRIVFDLFTGQPITVNNFFFISRSNWFIPVYLGLVLFTPALNAMCNSLPKRNFQITLLSLLVFEFYMGYSSDKLQFEIGITGITVFAFMILYLIGRSVKMYGVPIFVQKHCVVLYIVTSIVLAAIYYVGVYFGHGGGARKMLSYSSPLVIFSALCFLLIFVKMKISTSKVINHISKSVLAVLLVHACREASVYLHSQYEFLFANYSGGWVVILWIIAILTTFVFAVILDQFRIFSWKIIQKQFFK